MPEICSHGCPFLCCDSCVANGACVNIPKTEKQEEHETVTFTCPFCGETAGLLADDLEGEMKVFGVIHALPPCRVFLLLNGGEYCEAVTRANARRN